MRDPETMKPILRDAFLWRHKPSWASTINDVKRHFKMSQTAANAKGWGTAEASLEAKALYRAWQDEWRRLKAAYQNHLQAMFKNRRNGARKAAKTRQMNRWLLEQNLLMIGL